MAKTCVAYNSLNETNKDMGATSVVHHILNETNKEMGATRQTRAIPATHISGQEVREKREKGEKRMGRGVHGWEMICVGGG